MNQTQDTVPRLLEKLRGGDRSALDELFGLLYEELKEIAGRQRRRWQGNYTLDTTALLHDAYVRLVGRSSLDVESRAHFRALSATAMRHILCDYARDRAAVKRSIDLLEQALALDPEFARAYSALAAAYVVLPGYAGETPDAHYQKAAEAARQALARDPNLAEAHAVLATIDQNEWDWADAEAGFFLSLIHISEPTRPY